MCSQYYVVAYDEFLSYMFDLFLGFVSCVICYFFSNWPNYWLVWLCGTSRKITL